MSTSHTCAAPHRARAAVNGDQIASVTFYVDGKKVKTVTQPNSSGSYVLSMSCSKLSVGAHRARAAVSFTSGSNKSVGFQLTRTRAASPRFTG